MRVPQGSAVFAKSHGRGKAESNRPGPRTLFLVVESGEGRAGSQVLLSEPGQQFCTNWGAWAQHCLGRATPCGSYFKDRS